MEEGKVKMPADGGGFRKGEPDGVSGTPGSDDTGRVHGRTGGGESAGGAYPNPNSDPEPSGEKSSKAAGIRGHDGQSEKAYYGGANPNATTGGGILSDAQDGSEDGASPIRKSHAAGAEGQDIEVIEDSGIAAAEATGKVATDAPYENEQKNPGSG